LYVLDVSGVGCIPEKACISILPQTAYDVELNYEYYLKSCWSYFTASDNSFVENGRGSVAAL